MLVKKVNRLCAKCFVVLLSGVAGWVVISGAVVLVGCLQ